MIKEHLVSASVTNGTECICNPEVLLGTKYGLWDFENELAPRGALMDLNAAWELFLSRRGFSKVSFDTHEHHGHEVIDGVVYDDGDTTYTLKDDNGNPTGATFTIKANKGPVEHIEWEDGKLILYYTKLRPLEDKDLQSGAPIHYVTDEEGTVITDPETGKPLIYDYVMIPVIEIFDNDETRLLFPWYSDDNNVTQLRDSIDGRTGHLGSFAITPESEVYYSKEVEADKNLDLISLLSVQNQLNSDLGFAPNYVQATDYPDPDDGEYHTYRASGSNLSDNLHTGFGDKSSVVAALNEDLVRTRINTRLMADKIVESNLNWQDLLEFADSIKNQAFKNSTVPNLLAALNWIQTAEIGPFKEEINTEIKKDVIDDEGNPQRETVDNITEALNTIFGEAEENRARIGYDAVNRVWIALNTDSNENLTEAINEVDLHENALAEIILVREEWDPVRKLTFYSNPDLNDITKNRLRLNQVKKDNVTVIEAVNELQAQIGNLSSSKSGDNSVQLSTDSKDTVVEAINEVDLHADNNAEVLGAEYELDAVGKKTGEITNLETTDKSSIVAAINELDSRVGELDDLDTEDKTNIVSAINEVIKELPIVYENVNDVESGVVLKDLSQDQSKTNHAGKYSLAVGTNNDIAANSFASGSKNISLGSYTTILGYNNNSKKNFNTVSGKSNTNDGSYNLVNGLSNTVTGSNNIVSGSNNNVETINSVILGDNIRAKGSDNIIVSGNTIVVKDNVKDAIALGKNSKVNGDDSIALGESNFVSEGSVAIGHNNETEGPGNVAIGDSNYIGCDNSYTFGKGNRTEGDHTYVVGEGNTITGNKNYALGENQVIEGNGNVAINATNRVRANNAIVIGDIQNVHDNSTHIGGDIYINTHETESKLQGLITVDLNDWCKSNNAASLNGEKFLDTQHLVNALKVYLSREYSDSAILRFMMHENNENGYILVQGKATRIFLNGCWYFSDNIENGWSRHDGEYLKVIKKTIVDSNGNTKDKYYLTLMDLLSTESKVDTVGAQRSNSEDFKNIDLTHGYGAVDIEDINTALDLNNRFNTKVDKYAKIITKHQDDEGVITERSYNWIDTNDNTRSADITLSLLESFGFNKFDYQNKSERGRAGGYVPLDMDGKINSDFLPSYVDDVIDVWAEYTVAGNQDLTDIHLYEIINDVDATGSEVIRKGEPILIGERGKIYVEAQPKLDGRVSYQFRYTGTRFVAIGAHIVIGEVEGTAFDGGRGKALEDAFDDHKKSGTTTIPVLDEQGLQKKDELGNPMWVIYKPNPHNVQAEQLPVSVNDPNNPNNTTLEETYIVEHNVKSAIVELFSRVNKTEDESGQFASIFGTPEEIAELDNLDGTEGNDFPTVIGAVLKNKEKLDSIQTLGVSNISDIVDDYFDI